MPENAAVTDLAELVEPLSAGAFRALLASRQPLHQPGAGGDRYAALLDWDAFIDLLHRGDVPHRDIRLYRNRVRVPPLFLRDAGPQRGEMIDRLLAADASIMLNRAEEHVAALGRLCAAVAEQSGDHVSAAVVATAGRGGALDRHYDAYDIVVLQVDGAKRWTLYEDPAINPVPGMPKVPARQDAGPATEYVLNPGDWLFVPAGYRHRCDTIGARSLHLGILFHPLTAVRAVELIVQEMLLSTEDRAPLRVKSATSETVEAALKQRLIARIAALSIDDLARRHRTTGIQSTDNPTDG
ncbi:MAG: JmjC domain-containing protein [Sphingomonas sp.]|uniref:JmjC domain-containing protein n=1 Tax=Sphingomonas sp. TaxID=28214 RepID=UPI003F7ED90D